MSFEIERKDIESRFLQQWASTTPIAWENVAFAPPSNSAWVRLSILNGESEQVSIAYPSAQHRTFGAIMVGIFVPRDMGSAGARVYADQAAAIFRDAVFGTGIRCRAPYIDTVGEDGAFFHINVIVPYQRDNLFTVS